MARRKNTHQLQTAFFNAVPLKKKILNKKQGAFCESYPNSALAENSLKKTVKKKPVSTLLFFFFSKVTTREKPIKISY